MGYAFNQTCYLDCNTAHEAFQKSFPIVASDGLIGFVSSSVNASCVVSYSVNQRLWTSNTLNSRTGTTRLVPCADVDISPFDAATASAIFIMFFAAIVSVWVVSKNIGLIVDAIKKW